MVGLEGKRRTERKGRHRGPVGIFYCALTMTDKKEGRKRRKMIGFHLRFVQADLCLNLAGHFYPPSTLPLSTHQPLVLTS